MTEDLVDELESEGSDLSLRAARHIRIKRTTCRLLEEDRHSKAQRSLATEINEGQEVQS